MAAHNDLGRWGEEVAVAHLAHEGYIIKERDWRSGKRDLDIVALTPDGLTLVVVEVKTRSSADDEDPLLAVNDEKIRNLAIATRAYIRDFTFDKEIRFDIITVVGRNETNCTVEHITDAFNPLLL